MNDRHWPGRMTDIGPDGCPTLTPLDNQHCPGWMTNNDADDPIGLPLWTRLDDRH